MTAESAELAEDPVGRDGIFGMGYPALSVDGVPPILYQLARQHDLSDDVFAIYVQARAACRRRPAASCPLIPCRHHRAHRVSSLDRALPCLAQGDSGRLSIGGTDPSAYVGTLLYANLTSETCALKHTI